MQRRIVMGTCVVPKEVPKYLSGDVLKLVSRITFILAIRYLSCVSAKMLSTNSNKKFWEETTTSAFCKCFHTDAIGM